MKYDDGPGVNLNFYAQLFQPLVYDFNFCFSLDLQFLVFSFTDSLGKNSQVEFHVCIES